MPKIAQVALEYLMIIALTLGIILPTTYLFFQYASESNDQILDAQINKIGRSIVDTAGSVFYFGKDAKIVLEINMPKNVNDINIIDKRELVFNIDTQIGETEMVFFSSVDIISNLPQAPVCRFDGNCELKDISGAGSKKVKITTIEDPNDPLNTVVEISKN